LVYKHQRNPQLNNYQRYVAESSQSVDHQVLLLSAAAAAAAAAAPAVTRLIWGP
jgi:hypothetical protein